MSNPYLKDFREQLRSKFAEDSEAMSYSSWISLNTTLRKKPFSFARFEFQKQIVDDMSANMYVIKCSQVGLTEVQLRKFAAFLTRNTGVNGIFSLPNNDMSKRVSQTRWKPMIDNDQVFSLGADKPIRSVPLTQIGQSFGYFVGNTIGDATSINADMLLHDELDISDQEVIALFQSRLQGSDWRITQNFSTPTYEGFAIDAGFRISDQHEYLLRCEGCNHHNIPAFNPTFVVIPGLSADINDLTELDDPTVDGLDLSAAYLRCEKCGHRLERGNPDLWQWVSRFPSRRARGYQVTPFMSPKLDIAYIVDQLLKFRRKDALRHFHNTVLGRAYNDSKARLSELEIRAVMQGSSEPDIDGSMPVIVGIDVGLICHVTLYHVAHQHPVAFAWKQVPSDQLIQFVEQLMKRYNIIGGGMDRNPYTPLANEVRDMTNGIILPIEYATTKNAAAVHLVRDELGELDFVRINRTIAIDALVSAVRKRRIEFYGYGQHEVLLIQHLRDMIRIEQEDENATWQKLTGNDHFFHSSTIGYYATRVSEAVWHNLTSDKRVLSPDITSTAAMQNDASLGVKARRRETMSLGTI